MHCKSLGKLQERPAKWGEKTWGLPQADRTAQPIRYQLTQRRQEILDFIAEYYRQHGQSPSQMEIADAVGISSSSTINGHIRALEEMGHIRTQARRMRSIELCGGINRFELLQIEILNHCNVAIESEGLRRALVAAGWRV